MKDRDREICQIFISYRRDGSDAHARVFYEKLKQAGFTVFLDFESLFSGGFECNILNAIDSCEDFILLLPKNGLERCKEENDILRKEIRQALNGKKNIIPVFINGFKMPSQNDLPDDIAAITDINGFECSMEYFDAVFRKLLRNLISRPKDVFLYETLDVVREKVLSVDHDYFKKWICIKLNEFIETNAAFFDGTNSTNPHAEDTFGISGIGFTKKSIKALSSINDYWDDGFTKEYLEKQADMISKGIDIIRIFVVDMELNLLGFEQMERQYNLGIKVYYIEKDNEFINPLWLLEDYLIQDDELLVQIFCESHRFIATNNQTEKITMNPSKVKIMVERFHRLLECSTKFSPDSFKPK